MYPGEIAINPLLCLVKDLPRSDYLYPLAITLEEHLRVLIDMPKGLMREHTTTNWSVNLTIILDLTTNDAGLVDIISSSPSSTALTYSNRWFQLVTLYLPASCLATILCPPPKDPIGIGSYRSVLFHNRSTVIFPSNLFIWNRRFAQWDNSTD